MNKASGFDLSPEKSGCSNIDRIADRALRSRAASVATVSGACEGDQSLRWARLLASNGSTVEHARASLVCFGIAGSLSTSGEPVYESAVTEGAKMAARICDSDICEGFRAAASCVLSLKGTRRNASGRMVPSKTDKALIESLYEPVFAQVREGKLQTRPRRDVCPLADVVQAMSVLSLLESPMEADAVESFKLVVAEIPEEKIAPTLATISSHVFLEGSSGQKAAHTAWMDLANCLEKQDDALVMREAAAYAECLALCPVEQASGCFSKTEGYGVEVSMLWDACGQKLMNAGRTREALDAADEVLKKQDLCHPITEKAMRLGVSAAERDFERDMAHSITVAQRIVDLGKAGGHMRSAGRAEGILCQAVGLGMH